MGSNPIPGAKFFTQYTGITFWVKLNLKDFDVEKARKIQRIFADKILFKDIDLEKIRYVGGVDVSYRKGYAVAAAVTMDYKTLKVFEVKKVKVKDRFPYIPTLLSFREAPPVFKVVRMLNYPPDVLIVEGHGVSHPYGCGLASHIGVVLKMPTIGVAKNLLCGKLGEYKGNKAPIFFNGKIVGMAVITKPKTKPVYVSVGNMITLDKAVKIVEKCIKNSKIPEPIRIAHLLTKSVKEKI